MQNIAATGGTRPIVSIIEAGENAREVLILKVSYFTINYNIEFGNLLMMFIFATLIKKVK